MAEDQNVHSIVRSMLGLTDSQQPMETNALIRELAIRLVASGVQVNSTGSSVLITNALDANLVLEVSNTGTGTASAGALRARADVNTTVVLVAHNPNRTVARFGITLGGWIEMLVTAVAGKGLVIGTNLAGPLVFGTTNLERMRIAADGNVNVASVTATPAGGSTDARLLFGTTAGFGIYYGSGAPTVSAAQGSLYLRSDGSSTSTRMYVNTDGGTTWTSVTTAA